MPSVNFPNSPTLNQQHTQNGQTWTWVGTRWVTNGSAGSAPSSKNVDGGFASSVYLPAQNIDGGGANG